MGTGDPLVAHVEACGACRDTLACAVAGEPTGAEAGTGERYTVLEELGRGGHARVLAAYDTHVGREVAIKEPVLPDDPCARARAEVRFLREATVTAQLVHPAIAPVHEVGRDVDGTPYYTMSRIRGRTLADAIRECASLEERLGLLRHVIDTCHAVAYAHSRGVLHRDLKPRNIMLGEFGETIVLDWGLARVGALPLDSSHARPLGATDASSTQVGEVLGTPSYMSPEQARGDAAAIDERSDVWGLGAVLYEVLAGVPPFDGPSATAVVRTAARERPRSVVALCPDAPAELVAIAERALQPDAGQRYRLAAELAADLDAFAAGRRVTAHAYGVRELLGRFVRRHKLTSAVAAAALIVLAAVIATYQRGLISNRDAAREAERIATAQSRAAERARDDARHNLALALTEQARSARSAGAGPAATLLAATALTHAEVAGARGVLIAEAGALIPDRVWRSPDVASSARRDHGTEIWSVVSDATHRELISVDLDGEVRIRGLDDGVLRAAFTVRGVERVAVSPRGGIALAGPEGRLWIADGHGARRELAHMRSAVHQIAFVADRIAAITEDGRVEIVDDSGRSTATLALSAPLRSLAVSPDGTRLAIGDDEGTLHVWTIGRARATAIAAHRGTVYDVVFTTDGSAVISAGLDGVVKRSAVAGRAASTVITTSRTPMLALAIEPSSGQIIAAGADRAIHVWDATGKPSTSFPAHGGVITDLVVDGDGGLVSCSDDATLARWRVPRSPVAWGADRYQVAVGVTFAADERTLAVGAAEGVVERVDATTGAAIDRWRSSSVVNTVAILPDGVASAHDDGVVRGWSADSPVPRSLVARDTPVRSLVFDAFRDRLLVGDDAGRIVSWRRATGEVSELARLDHAVTDLVLAPDGGAIATATSTGIGPILDATSGRPVAAPASRGYPVRSLAWMADGRRVAYTDVERAVHVVDLADPGAAAARFAAPTDISAVAVASSGLIAGGAMDGSIVLWDAAGRLVAHYDAHAQIVTDLTFSRDDARLASTGADGVVRVWDLSPLIRSPAHILAELRRRTGLVVDETVVAAEPARRAVER